ncbi:T9SS sorting signal type C domain-containing protein [Flavobacterium undicola]|uniref:T9SS sorting signal type C domain-containing protein n=2 Tax=Flavobacterium undicola TaxID=1932779 RepID=UPI00137785FC|nr:T9SS sorting signal type C domain-containing protein [Flavobacterium undicola]MBA0885098.1 T9SS sorting signal type C domain-containing protein [Flavobacterium undicola]
MKRKLLQNFELNHITQKKYSIILLIGLFIVGFNQNVAAQCFITTSGTVNASTFTCGTSPLSTCNGTLTIGNGSSITSIYMDAELNLTCLGAIQVIVKNNGSFDFSPGNNRLLLAEGSSITFEPGSDLIGGSCNASERIYIGTNLLASCNGGAGADLSFADLLAYAGTGSLASNSPVCVGSQITLTATPPPTSSGTFTYSFSGPGLAATSFSSSPTYSFTATSGSGGTYQVKIKNSGITNPMIAEISVSVNTLPATPTITAGGSTTFCAGGSVTLTSSAGTTYLWSTGETTASITPTTSGSYTVKVTNVNGCQSASSLATVVTVYPISTIVLTSGTQSPTVCAGTAITNTVYTFSGSATNASVSGLPAGLSSAVNVGAKTVTISGIPTASGTYTITTSGHTAPCTAATISGTVTMNAASSIVLTSGTQNPTVCEGTAITNTVYTFAGSATNASVSGLPTGLSSVVNVGAKTVTISGIPTASGTYTIITSGHTTPCTATTISGTVTMNVASAIVLTSGTQNPTVCEGTAITNTVYTFAGSATNVSVSGLPAGLSSAVNVGAKTVTISGTPTAGGTYTITTSGHTAPCTAATISGAVTVNALPNNVINGFSATTICAGGSPQLTFDAEDSAFSAPYSITYKNDATLIQYTIAIPSSSAYSFAPADNPTSNTGYTLISISNASCTTTTAGIVDSGANLIVRPIPTATISGTTSVCVGDSSPNITFTNPQTVAVTVTYTINGGTNQTINIAATSFSNIAVATTVAGAFVYNLVSVVYQSNPNCSNALSGSATVTVNPNLPASVSISASPPGAICSGTSVTFTATPTNGGTTPSYQWKLNGVNVGSNSTTYANAALANGDVVTCVMTSNATPCLTGSPATSNSSTITVNALPTAGLTSSDADNTFCAGTSVTFTASGGTNYNFRVGGSSVQNSAIATYSTTALTNGQVVDVIVTNSSGCIATSSGIANTVNALPTAGLTSSDADNTFCAGTSVTFTASGGTNYNFRVGGSSVQNSAIATYSTTALTNGQVVDVIVTNSSGCIATSSGIANTVNALPTAPTVGILIQPTCVVTTGSVELSGLPASGTWTINPGGYTGTGTTTIISGLVAGTYNFTVSDGSCASLTTANVVINPVITNTWTTSWSNGTPTILQAIVFNGNFSSIADLDACSCQVTTGASVVINSGHTLKITNQVEVLGTGSLTFENNASLVQINDAAINTGNINYKRYTTPVRRYDFTYWSSPVMGQTLYNLSPNTLGDKYYGYNPNTGWVIYYNGAATMIAGNGYLIRAPQTFSITVAAIDTNPVFIGKPNNGVVSLALTANKSYLLGNPYPSAINADVFLDTNSAVLEGTLYFWTHNTSPSNAIGTNTYIYTTNDYATYNRTGSVSTGIAAVTGGLAPTGKIAAGQGFFAPAKATGNVVFNNSMRIVGGASGVNNSQFFKLSTASKTSTAAVTTEKSRIWLNLTNKEGAFKQTLVGYITGATNNYDAGFDGVSYDGNQFVDFYSVNQAVNLSIQGRELPFEKKDSIALGYKSTIKGEFQISIDHADGELTSQAVFLEDKVLKVLHDLRKEPYSFNTEVGRFNSRFVLRYVDKNAVQLVVDTLQIDKTVLVSVNKNEISVSSTEDLISKIIIYDVSGKILYQKDEIAANDFVVQHLLSTQQVLFVNVVLTNGKTTSTKIIY